MDDCLFCKIIKGEISASKIYEDDEVVAFLDIFPVNPGHTLVVPKEHHDDFLSLPGDLSLKLMAVVKQIVPAVLRGVGAEGFNLGLNNGKLAGQAIGHVHWHIMPRFENDGHKLFSGQPYPEGRAAEILEKIKSNL